MDEEALNLNLHGWHIAVLVPARNEEALLPRCLKSILRAKRLLPVGVSSDVVVVSDGSTDATVERAQHALRGSGVVIASGTGCVGSARALAARIALARHAGSANLCWLANTDADCEVPSNWLRDQLRLAIAGSMAVAGTVEVRDFSEHLPVVEQRFRDSYTIHLDGSHPHVHGANLGVRADAYLLAGGWRDLMTAEDHDLWARLAATGATRRSDARLQVLTSGRRIGRAPSGFADTLAAHNGMVAA